MAGAFINSIGKFLPGEAIDNDRIEEFLGKIDNSASKIKSRILKSNGIKQRYYALDNQQNITYRNSEMAAYAVKDTILQINLEPEAIDLLACATSWSDLLIPSFASMVHGELSQLSPLEIISTQGVCCAGVAALNYAYAQIQLGKRKNAIAVASELASRLFINTKFEIQDKIKKGEKLPFDTEFLRWMLSDGAGAFLIQDRPRANGISLEIEWIELISHANVYPLCMYAGTEDITGKKSWMDYPSYAEAAAAGAIDLRQDIRRLEDVIKLGVEGWLRLIQLGKINTQKIDWFLCHYSSHFFRSQIIDLLQKADCMVDESKWFTNLYTRGNTGCASIYLMLEELFNSGKLQPGEKIFCFVPESGRYTTAYMMLKVVEASDRIALSTFQNQQPQQFTFSSPVDNLNTNNSTAAKLLRELTLVWLEFDRRLHSVSIVRKLERGEFTLEDYKALLRNLRPQVVEGARWIARAASNMVDFHLRSTFIGHAQEEHRDFQMLEKNYVSVGGKLEEIVTAEKNIGSEALSAFIFDRASQNNPVDLIGSIFIVEGLGNQMAGKWASLIKKTLNLTDEQVSFLGYHSNNDSSHIQKLEAIINAEWMTPEIAKQIVKTARITARLYAMQLEEIES
jgi:3-oxoacyl-[acyl-carrier-protein] synthase III